MATIEERTTELMALLNLTEDTARTVAMFEAGLMTNDIFIVDENGESKPAPLGKILGE